MIEFEIMVRGLYRPNQLAIDYHPGLCMPITPQIQEWMDNLWEQRLIIAREQKIPLFDAPLFRLVSASSVVLSEKDVRLHLVLGDTGYKEYVATRTPEFSRTHTREELGNALSVCSVVETSDHAILLDKRQGVDVHVGRYHVIGGFFERNCDVITETARPDPFAAMRREIREETGIQADDIHGQYCLGVVYDLTTPHAEICFLTCLNITLDEVMHNRTAEDDEIKQLLSLQVTEESLREFIVSHHGNISPTGEPNLLLYGAQKFGDRWLEDIMSNIS